MTPMMKILLSISILVILAGIGAVLYFGNSSQPVSVTAPGQVGLPGAPFTGGSGTVQTRPQQAATSSSSTTLTIVANNGVITTNDFIHNGITIEDPSNAGNYYLTGSSTDGYAIGYRTPAQFFTIALQREPLGETRAAAETFLLSKLGISEEQMCHLNYYVGTDSYTNSAYAGKDLGFSFCPDSVALPK